MLFIFILLKNAFAIAIVSFAVIAAGVLAEIWIRLHV